MEIMVQVVSRIKKKGDWKKLRSNPMELSRADPK